MADIANTPINSTLRAIRASLDLTQQQLADRLGVSFTTVNRWEDGVTAPQRAARIASTPWPRRPASTLPKPLQTTPKPPRK